MLLMEKIYNELAEVDLVDNAEEFSIKWCNKSRSWFAVQKNKGGDLTIQTAICLLNYVKVRRAIRFISRKQLGSILDDEIDLLTSVVEQLDSYLLDAHQIVAVAETDRLRRIC